MRGGINEYGTKFSDLHKICRDFTLEIKNSSNTPLLSILLEGRNGCGKTAFAAKLALESEFPFVKFISPENYVGYNEHSKI